MQMFTRKSINRIINRLVSFNLKRSYTIYKTGEDEYKLVKILNVYKEHNGAVKDMVFVVCNNITEYELLKRNAAKDVDG